MPLSDDLPTSSPSRLPEDSLAYYKSQYEQLEAELADFQASSKELEAELEKDVEASEKRERQLREKVEGLGYEVEEWKTKYKQAKAEANTAQNALQKEITSLRDTNRTIQHRLRDIEVSNDDMERQARNTTSSLEDLESKYNVAIERGVMAEDEIRSGEQEREHLRIETQRLRDELNDLRIEADIRQNKLQKAESLLERQHKRIPAPIASDLEMPQPAVSELSPTTTASSPGIATPPTKSASSTVSDTQTPPSPPTSDKSNSAANTTPAPSFLKSRLPAADSNVTPKPMTLPRQSRRPSIPVNTERTPRVPRRTTLSRPEAATPRAPGLVQSGSLHHLHGLMSKMQLLEQRVHSVRSKLPAPTSTPPRASPRSGSALGQSHIPATVTLRSNKKRTSASTTNTPSERPASRLSSAFNPSTTHTPSERPSSRLSSTFTGRSPDRPLSRLSFGIPQPTNLSTRDAPSSRPQSRQDNTSYRPPSRDNHHNTFSNRPASRASLSSRQSISHLPSSSTSSTSRPGSRQSMSGARTPLGHYSQATAQSEARSRPLSGMGGSYHQGGHAHSASMSRNYGSQIPQYTDEEDVSEVLTPTPSRRTTAASKAGEPVSSIPALPSSKGRLSGVGVGGGAVGRRISSGGATAGAGAMGPPEKRMTRKLSEVGESY